VIKEKIIREKIDGEWVVTVPEVVLKRLLEQSEEVKSQQAEIDSLSMAHDNMARELSLFKEKDKHELIKNLIARNREVSKLRDVIRQNSERVQELEDKLTRIRFVNNDYDKQNKRYREALEFYADEDNWVYGKVQHIVRGEKAREALEEEEK